MRRTRGSARAPIREPFRIRQDQGAIFRQIKEVLIEYDVERDLVLDQHVFHERGFEVRPEAVVGQRGKRTQNCHVGHDARRGVAPVVIEIEANVSLHVVGHFVSG